MRFERIEERRETSVLLQSSVRIDFDRIIIATARVSQRPALRITGTLAETENQQERAGEHTHGAGKKQTTSTYVNYNKDLTPAETRTAYS